MSDRISGRMRRKAAEQHIAELTEQVERLEEQRDRLRGRVDRLMRDEALDYVFVLTYGRSGSTLVQGLLNSIPGYLIRGENRQLMRHLWAYDQGGVRERRVQRRKQRLRGAEEGSSDVTSPLFGMDNFAHGQALRYCRRMAVETLFRPEEDTRVTGFKEVEWGEPDTPQYVDWLTRVFPGARFVVNTRNLEDVAGSAWWAEDPGARDELRRREDLLLSIRDSLGETAHHIHYDEFTQDPSVLRSLFAWLGEEFDEQRVREVLGTRHSYRPRRERGAGDSAVLRDLDSSDDAERDERDDDQLLDHGDS